MQLAEEELTALQPADDKTLLLERFFEPDQLDLILLSGRSLYLAPSLPAARQPFALLLAALRSAEKWALGRVVLSSNRQVVIVRPDEQTLVIHVLYFPAQQRAVVGIEPDGLELTRKDVAAMQRIVRASNGQIPWDQYQDESERRLTQLVQAKVAATSAATVAAHSSVPVSILTVPPIAVSWGLKLVAVHAGVLADLSEGHRMAGDLPLAPFPQP